MKPKASLRYRCNRIRRALKLKLRLSAALLVAGAFSIANPRESWPRVTAALHAWLRWRREPAPAPFWIYVARYLKCQHCVFFFAPLKTCGTPLRKELRDVGCHCDMEIKCGFVEADCWAREQGVDESLGWPDSLRRLSLPLPLPLESGMTVFNDGRTHNGHHPRNAAPCRPCGSDAL